MIRVAGVDASNRLSLKSEAGHQHEGERETTVKSGHASRREATDGSTNDRVAPLGGRGGG